VLLSVEVTQMIVTVSQLVSRLLPGWLQRLTRSMLGRMLDPEHGITQAAATCPSYAIDDAAVMQQSQWAQEVSELRTPWKLAAHKLAQYRPFCCSGGLQGEPDPYRCGFGICTFM
jgi:hypothetical protein